ncbi:hypothetical protein ACWKSP_04810 [Micromonosporaceae bacterium Da 78-11]
MPTTSTSVPAAARLALILGIATVIVAAGGPARAEVVAADPVTSPSFNGPVYAVAYRPPTARSTRSPPPPGGSMSAATSTRPTG